MANIVTTDSIKKNNLNDVSDEQIKRMCEQMGDTVKNEPRVAIFLPEDPNKPSDKQMPKEVGINGYMFKIPVGREVEVPYCVYTILQRLRLVR